MKIKHKTKHGAVVPQEHGKTSYAMPFPSPSLGHNEDKVPAGLV